MKSTTLGLFMIYFMCVTTISAQSTLTPSFNAVVVSNIESSTAWYKSVLNLKEKSTMLDPAGTYKIKILSSENFVLELLELASAVNKKQVLEGKPAGTHVQGLFKFGFKASNLDELLKHLQSNHISVAQIYKDDSGKRNFIITDPDGNYIQFFE